MREPVGKDSGRTVSTKSTYVPDPCWSSLWVMSSLSPKMSIRPPSEALKSGLPMAVFATDGLKVPLNRSGQLFLGHGRGSDLPTTIPAAWLANWAASLTPKPAAMASAIVPITVSPAPVTS